MNFVKVISSELDKVKRRLIKVLRVGRSDVRTALEASPHGIDSVPIKDLIAIYSETGHDGDTVIIGYLNKNRLADVGENRLFSLDENGALSTFIWIKNDGTIQLGGDSNNAMRFQPTDNGLQSFITALNLELALIATAITGAGGTYVPNTMSIDIDSAKIDEIKTN